MRWIEDINGTCINMDHIHDIEPFIYPVHFTIVAHSTQEPHHWNLFVFKGIYKLEFEDKEKNITLDMEKPNERALLEHAFHKLLKHVLFLDSDCITQEMINYKFNDLVYAPLSHRQLKTPPKGKDYDPLNLRI